jgi:hypothetical protein
MRRLLAACLLWHAGAAFALPDDVYGTHWLDGVAAGAPSTWPQIAIASSPGSFQPEQPPEAAAEHGVAYWLGSWQAMLFCQLADIASSEWAFRHNPGAYETNGISKPVLYSVKVAIPFGMRQFGWNDLGDLGIRVGLNALACLPVINNIQVGRQR